MSILQRYFIAGAADRHQGGLRLHLHLTRGVGRTRPWHRGLKWRDGSFMAGSCPRRV